MQISETEWGDISIAIENNRKLLDFFLRKNIELLYNDENKWVQLISSIILLGLSISQVAPRVKSINKKGAIPVQESLVKEIELLTKLNALESNVLYMSLYLYGFSLGRNTSQGMPKYLRDGEVTPVEHIGILLKNLINQPPLVLKFFQMGIEVGELIPSDLISTAKAVQGGERDQHDWEEIKEAIRQLVSKGMSYSKAKKQYSMLPGTPSSSQLNRRIKDPGA